MPGLYLHVPFCAKKCHYCDFVIAPGVPSARRGAFFDALEGQMRDAAARTEGAVFETVYLGGGTPSVLDAVELERLFGLLHAHFRWEERAEITCEANPGDVDLEQARHLKRLGVGRVSLGAQSFHDDTLKRLNRAHSAEDTGRSFGALREAGFTNLNLDLILSLPGEPWEKARVSLDRLAALGPEHVSLYELTIEEKTVFGTLAKKGKLDLPDEERQFEILANARAFLERRGWRHYELLNYAKPGFESRHNLLYWANADTIGLGPGAWSHWKGRRWRHSDTYDRYLQKAALGDWRPLEEEELSPEKKETESFLLALRLSDGASASRFESVMRRFAPEIRELTEKGLLSERLGRVRLTERGRFLAETVFAELSC